MYSPKDKSYQQARSIKLGQYHLHTRDQQMVDWIKKEFQVSALDFYVYKVETSTGYRQQHLVVIVETVSDRDKIDQPSNNFQIAEHFRPYFSGKTRSDDSLKRKIFPMNSDGSFPEIIVGYCALENIELKVACEKANPGVQALAEKYPDLLWTISQNMQNWDIFYFTNAQLAECNQNGFTDQLKKAILAELKKYDDFDYFGQHSLNLSFNSKEDFDETYQGNWYYFYK